MKQKSEGTGGIEQQAGTTDLHTTVGDKTKLQVRDISSGLLQGSNKVAWRGGRWRETRDWTARLRVLGAGPLTNRPGPFEEHINAMQVLDFLLWVPLLQLHNASTA